jgi:hypothetical protein
MGGGLDQLVAVAGSITGDQGTAAERHLQDTRGGFADMDLAIPVKMVFQPGDDRPTSGQLQTRIVPSTW